MPVIIEDAEGKSALENFLREIYVSREGGGTFVSTRRDSAKEEVSDRLFLTREWPIYRDADRIDPISEKDKRNTFLEKALNLTFLSTDTGGPILATPKISAPITILFALDRKEEAEQVVAKSIRGSQGYTIKFSAEEMEKVRAFVASYGVRKNPPLRE